MIPIGVGAGGRVKDYELFHLNKIVTFYAFDNELKLNVKKLSGILQYKEVELEKIKEYSGKSYENIFKLIKEYEAKGLVTINDNIMEYTIDGIFWGNSITASLVTQIIDDNK